MWVLGTKTLWKAAMLSHVFGPPSIFKKDVG